jgi:hypothetical protein
MRRTIVHALAGLLCFAAIAAAQTPIIIDHTCTDLAQVPESAIAQAKQQFRISYGHTSHGSQIVSGMALLRALPGSVYTYSTDGDGGSLSLHDGGLPGDLSGSGDTAWAQATRALLGQSGCTRNMIMWSWCGGVSGNTVAGIDAYLNAMAALERDFPGVTFVYITGHLDGTGVAGNLHQRNEQIRAFCRANGKVLFDFADIESYDPDGAYFLDRFANDNCDYVVPGGGSGNWAQEWCAANPGKCGSCSCAHSQCLNCQQKGKAFWWMMGRLAGWSGVTTVETNPLSPTSPRLLPNYPNPFGESTTLRWSLPRAARMTLLVRDMTGRRVAAIIDDEPRSAGEGEATFTAAGLAQGLYVAELTADGRRARRPIMLVR